MNAFKPVSLEEARAHARTGTLALFHGAATNCPELKALLNDDAVNSIGDIAEALGEELILEGFTWEPRAFLDAILQRFPRLQSRPGTVA